MNQPGTRVCDGTPSVGQGRARLVRLALAWAFLCAAAAPAAAQTTGDASLRPAPTPEAVGIDPLALAVALERAEYLSPLNSLLIARDGQVVAERYYRGMRQARQVNIKSASKSVLSALVGIALREGYLESVDQTLPELLPDRFPADAPPLARTITLRNLLTMTAGLETTSFGNYGRWVSSRNWVRSAMDRRMVDRPGGRMIYSTGNSHLVSAILTRATGMSTLAFARRYLFEPLDIVPPRWDRDPQGIYLGGNNMALRPIDLLKIGQLYLDGGVYDGERILPASWIRESWRGFRRSRWNGHGYGYFWWQRRMAGREVHFGWGYGGQYLFVVPSLELVVVATSAIGSGSGGGGWRYRRTIHDLVERYVLPAVELAVETRDQPLAAVRHAGPETAAATR